VYKYKRPSDGKEVIVIAEAKGGDSTLGSLDNGKVRQMSPDWVRITAERMRSSARAAKDTESVRLADEILEGLAKVPPTVERRIYRTPMSYPVDGPDKGKAVVLGTIESVL